MKFSEYLTNLSVQENDVNPSPNLHNTHGGGPMTGGVGDLRGLERIRDLRQQFCRSMGVQRFGDLVNRPVQMNGQGAGPDGRPMPTTRTGTITSANETLIYIKWNGGGRAQQMGYGTAIQQEITPA